MTIERLKLHATIELQNLELPCEAVEGVVLQQHRGVVLSRMEQIRKNLPRSCSQGIQF